uniref:Uncharacterized protein n=1 Tax=Timema cristinae TaxID=61476 RepID=A0A7R9H640_TIMCR|nr:unnamed protein product [Timema cristinae]
MLSRGKYLVSLVEQNMDAINVNEVTGILEETKNSRYASKNEDQSQDEVEKLEELFQDDSKNVAENQSRCRSTFKYIPSPPMHSRLTTHVEDMDGDRVLSMSELDDSDADKDWIPGSGDGDSEEEHIECGKNVNKHRNKTEQTHVHQTISESDEGDSEKSLEGSSESPNDGPIAGISEKSNGELQLGNNISRKRKRSKETWKRNVLKKRHNSGVSYINSRGKSISEKELQPPCGSKCKQQCSVSVSEEQRKEALRAYWNMGNVTLQRAFIVNCTRTITPKIGKTVKAQLEKTIVPTTFQFLEKEREFAKKCLWQP